MHQSLVDLWYGFGVALPPHNLMWSFFGVLVGNLIGVLPGMGALSAISMLLPLTYTMHPVPAFLMLAGAIVLGNAGELTRHRMPYRLQAITLLVGPAVIAFLLGLRFLRGW